jgi:hypothetical protein
MGIIGRHFSEVFVKEFGKVHVVGLGWGLFCKHGNEVKIYNTMLKK